MHAFTTLKEYDRELLQSLHCMYAECRLTIQANLNFKGLSKERFCEISISVTGCCKVHAAEIQPDSLDDFGAKPVTISILSPIQLDVITEQRGWLIFVFALF